MPRPEAHVEANVTSFVADVQRVLGTKLVCLALHGSAVGPDWVPNRSDVNTVIVVPWVTLDVLEALAPVVARWTASGFAAPVIMDHEYLTRARDTFPMEIEDIRRQHRVLAGVDVFSTATVDRAALRHECEYEARGKLLRLRALFLERAGTPAALEGLMLESLKSFLVVLRHLVRLRQGEVGRGYAEVLNAGEALLGPLPAMRRLLARRAGNASATPEALRREFGAYLGEVERIVAAVDALDG
jgi:hypothetical protein